MSRLAKLTGRFHAPCNLPGQFLGDPHAICRRRTELELPLPSRPGKRLGLRPALLLLGVIGGGVYAATDADTKPRKDAVAA